VQLIFKNIMQEDETWLTTVTVIKQ